VDAKRETAEVKLYDRTKQLRVWKQGTKPYLSIIRSPSMRHKPEPGKVKPPDGEISTSDTE
jgi:hypothetical protein